MRIELLNGAKHTKTILKEVIHAPDMAFTLISVGRLDDAKCSATFSSGMCTIRNLSGRTMVTIPCANGLYRVTAPEDPPTVNYVSIAMVKLTISKAHWKLGHIAPSAIKYAITKAHITGIQLDPESKPEFCEACAKAKAAQQPFPKESETRATKYRVRPLGPVGTSFSPKPQWKLVCGSTHRRCNLRNCALFPSKKESNHRFLQVR